MATRYTKTISTDFLNAKVASSVLEREIAESAIVTTLDHIDTSGDTCDIWFVGDLSQDDQNILDSLVAAHTGVNTTVEFVAASSLVPNEISITQDQTWQVLGGIVTNPNFFIANPSESIGRVVGEYQASGTGAELRLIEVSTGNVMNSNPYSLTDSNGSWVVAKFNTNVPPDATYVERLYQLEGRLNGATSAKVHFVSMSMLRIRTE